MAIAKPLFVYTVSCCFFFFIIFLSPSFSASPFSYYHLILSVSSLPFLSLSPSFLSRNLSPPSPLDSPYFCPFIPFPVSFLFSCFQLPSKPLLYCICQKLQHFLGSLSSSTRTTMATSLSSLSAIMKYQRRWLHNCRFISTIVHLSSARFCHPALPSAKRIFPIDFSRNLCQYHPVLL